MYGRCSTCNKGLFVDFYCEKCETYDGKNHCTACKTTHDCPTMTCLKCGVSDYMVNISRAGKKRNLQEEHWMTEVRELGELETLAEIDGA